MEIYKQLGIELAEDGWFWQGIHYPYDGNYSQGPIGRAVIQATRDKIKKHVAVLNEYGFEKFGWTYCTKNNITIHYTETIVDQWVAEICIFDAQTIFIRIRGMDDDYNIEEFSASFPYYMRTLKNIRQLRGFYIALFNANLPQPIAEEISEQFTL